MAVRHLIHLLLLLLLAIAGKSSGQKAVDQRAIMEQQIGLQKADHTCRHAEPPVDQGLGHGCELVITVLCDLHCTGGAMKGNGFTSGLCKPFDPKCYCQC